MRWLTMSFEPKNIQASTELIQNARTTAGFTTQLLLIIDNHSNPYPIRQAALVTLKTTVDSCYCGLKPGDP